MLASREDVLQRYEAVMK